MSHLDVIRAWKDPEYRLSLSEAQRAALPAHPAGLIELTEEDLANVGGGSWTIPITITIFITVFLCDPKPANVKGGARPRLF